MELSNEKHFYNILVDVCNWKIVVYQCDQIQYISLHSNYLSFISENAFHLLSIIKYIIIEFDVIKRGPLLILIIGLAFACFSFAYQFISFFKNNSKIPISNRPPFVN